MDEREYKINRVLAEFRNIETRIDKIIAIESLICVYKSEYCIEDSDVLIEIIRDIF